MKGEDGVDLPLGDFRTRRRYLHPQLFAGNDDDAQDYISPTDLIAEESWDGVMVLPTDVALKSTSYAGSLIARLHSLHSDWIFSWPDEEEDAPFMFETSLLAGEEFDALVFNATSGYYRQAIGCLRNALESLTVAASLSVHPNGWQLFSEWRNGTREVAFGQARAWLYDSSIGMAVESDAAPKSIFANQPSAWVNSRYAALCHYAHSRPGYNNADFWESNGPIFVESALNAVEREFRETIALAYLLLRLAWPKYAVGQGQPALLAGPTTGWTDYVPMLKKWLGVV